MNIIPSQMQKSYLRGLMSALMVGGAIASSQGYAFAQSQVLQRPLCISSPTNPCNAYTSVYKDASHSPAMEIDLILTLYPQAIAQLKKEDPFAVQKLRLGDLATIQRLEQLAPGSTLRLQSSLPVIQQLNQSVIAP